MEVNMASTGVSSNTSTQMTEVGTIASFRDPDGNEWQLQEITTRLPEREWED
jgi:predicted component of type VI protein secretion system